MLTLLFPSLQPVRTGAWPQPQAVPSSFLLSCFPQKVGPLGSPQDPQLVQGCVSPRGSPPGPGMPPQPGEARSSQWGSQRLEEEQAGGRAGAGAGGAEQLLGEGVTP